MVATAAAGAAFAVQRVRKALTETLYIGRRALEIARRRHIKVRAELVHMGQHAVPVLRRF